MTRWPRRFLSVKQRLARALLNVADYVGEKNGGGRIQLRLKISQGDLAAMAGVARENVSRTMSEWRKRDIVKRTSNYYCINDPKALARESLALARSSRQRKQRLGALNQTTRYLLCRIRR